MKWWMLWFSWRPRQKRSWRLHRKAAPKCFQHWKRETATSEQNISHQSLSAPFPCLSVSFYLSMYACCVQWIKSFTEYGDFGCIFRICRVILNSLCLHSECNHWSQNVQNITNMSVYLRIPRFPRLLVEKRSFALSYLIHRCVAVTYQCEKMERLLSAGFSKFFSLKVFWLIVLANAMTNASWLAALASHGAIWVFWLIDRHRRNQGWALGAIAPTPTIQEWQSTKNRRLEGPIPHVPLELLLNEKL